MHISNSRSHAEKGVANGMSSFTVKNIPTSSEHSSAKAIVKDHDSSAATQDDIKMLS